jgi:hypothetical protein
VTAIGRYSKAYELPEEQVLLRLDGQYGTGAVIADLAGFAFVMRGKDYQVLDRAEVQSRPTSSSPVQKVIWCVRSTIVLMCRWDRRDSAAEW